jgi:hypothetical protein
MLLRSSRNEEHEMSKGIIHTIRKAAEVETAEPFQRLNLSDEQPTVADLVLPGTGYKFSDEFACFLRVLGGESA